jgi:osmotically-inducible protein OsmY
MIGDAASEALCLMDSLLGALQISVTTILGIVSLSGEVESPSSLDRGDAIASNVANVESVRKTRLVSAA